MKSSRQILSHLRSLPQFGSLAQHHCYQKFLGLLPPRFQQAVAFVYIKNRTLFIALSHPGYKMELNYNKELFKELLATLRQHLPECDALVAEEVVLFNARHHTDKAHTVQESIPYYSELSSGTFSVESDDPTIREKFAQTQRFIAQNIDHDK